MIVKKDIFSTKKGELTLNLYVRNTHSRKLPSMRGNKGEEKWETEQTF